MRRFSRRILYIFVLLIIFLTHSTYLPNGFTWLDHGDIEQKRAVVALNQLPEIFVQPFGKTGFYRPVVTLFNSTDYALYQSFAPGYHLTNLLLHSAVVVMVPLFLSLFFTLSFFEMLLVMLIVGLHPIGSLPVGAISYRPELLVTFFILLTVYLHIKARQQSSPLIANVAVLSFFCALLSKETALVLIPLLIVFWEMTQKHQKKQPVLLLYIPEIVVICLYVFLHITAVPHLWNVPYFQANLSEHIGTRIVVLEKLLLHFINPFTPSLSDAVQLTSVFSLPVFLAVGGFGLLIFIIKRIKKHEARIKVIKVLFLFGILLLPALNIIPVPRVGSPHYAYLPLIGFAAIVILFLRFFLSQKKNVKRIGLSLFFLWFAICVSSTITSGSRFKNDATLFAPEVVVDPAFLEGYFYLGNYYASQKAYAKAEVNYTKAVQTRPDIVAYHEKESTMVNLALIKLQKGDTEAAVALFKSIMPLEDADQNKKLESFIKTLQKQSH